MTHEASGFYVRFTDIVLNPHIQALYGSLRALMPEAVWWITDPTVGRLPFPSGDEAAYCLRYQEESDSPEEHNERSRALQARLERNGELPICECCEGCLQGIAPFFFRGQFVGGIGVCHVPNIHRGVLLDVLRLVRGYLELLGNYLEDNDDLELVHSIWSETISVLDIDLLLERVSEELLRTVERKQGAIVLVDDDGDFRSAYLTGFGRRPEDAPPVGISRYDYSTRFRRLQEGANVLDDDDPLGLWFRGLCDLPLSDEGDQENADRGSDNGEVCMIPFVRNEQFVGGLFFPGPIPDMTHGRRRLLDLVALGSATALDNATIFLRMNQRQLALTTIHTVHRLMAVSRDLDQLLPRIVQLASQLMRVKKCSLMMMSASGERLIPRVSTGLKEGENGMKSVARGEGLQGWVAENFNPVIYCPQQEKTPIWDDDGLEYPDVSYLAVPLIEEDVRAVLTVSRQEGVFAPGDREILMTFAEQALIAVQNAEIHEEERDITHRTLESMSNLLDSHDPAHVGMTTRVGRLAGRLAEQFMDDSEAERDVTYAALVGNAGLLLRLGDEDRFTVRELTREDLAFSRTLAMRLKLSERVGETVYHMRETWDGRGVPDRLAGEQIPLGSRIILVAEAYLSLVDPSGKRSRKRTPQRALQILDRLSGRVYDPSVVSALKRVISEGSH